jgi:alkanesulfonate monooxygenase SsuD/methylene tetrahydromethanopterin reductase-like flavin-dependent oxidoreductase (luciferase family)
VPASEPFGAGTFAVGLHALDDLEASGQAAALVEQAVVAERAGFAGVTLSEHHDGFAGYMPQPLLAANWILAVTSRIWSGPAPLLLNLRNPVLAAEELAWAAARFPGRVGAALAPGYAQTDYDWLGVPFAERGARFDAGLATLLGALGRNAASPDADALGALGDPERLATPRDPALRAFSAPLVCAANSRVGVRRAARFGLGVLFPGGEGRERLASLIATYREAGGDRPLVKIRNLWLGTPPPGAIERRTAAYAKAAAPGMRQAAGFAEPHLHGDPEHIADELRADIATLGLTSMNLRFHLPGVGQEQVCEQIARFGAEVLPLLAAVRS